MSTSGQSWFDNDDALVGVLRGARNRSSAAPRIPGYENLRELRRGGQGVVFYATQASTRRPVAIKVLLDGALATREARRRFEREVDLIVGLRHPNIVQVYDSGRTSDDRLYYIMAYIEGAGLDEVIAASGTASRSLVFATPAATLAIFAKICDAVQYAHQRGVIHRDLKPSNVRIDPEGEPHVLDFGLAKSSATDDRDVSHVSRTGNFMGSLPWASPEHAQADSARIDVRSDVYSLGVMLYQLLSGQFPYSLSGPIHEILRNIIDTPPRALRDVRRDIDDETATIVMKCLAKEPERRYQSAGELARDIRRRLAGEPIEAKRDSAWYGVRKTLNRYRTFVRAMLALLVVSVLFSAATIGLWLRAQAAESLAQQRAAALEVSNRAEVAARKAVESQVVKTQKVADFLGTTLRAVEYWKSPGRDLGPLRELLDAATRRLDGAFPDQPEVEASLAQTLGFDYWTLGLHDTAEPLLRRAYRLALQTLGEEHPLTIGCAHDLGTMLSERRRHNESEPLLRHLLEVQCRALGPEDPRTLKTMNNLAFDLDWQGRLAEAIELYEETLRLSTQVNGPHSIDTLHTANNLATVLAASGRIAEGEHLLRQTVESRTLAFGAAHPETLHAKVNLAQAISDAGRYVEAAAMLESLAGEIEAAVGPNHPLMLSVLNNLGHALATLGRFEEGLECTERALAAQIALTGPESPETLHRKNQYMCSLVETNRLAEAIAIGEQLAEQAPRILTPDDPLTLTALGNLASCLENAGQGERSVEIWKKIIGTAGSPRVISSARISARANLGRYYVEHQQPAEAQAVLLPALDELAEFEQSRSWRAALVHIALGRADMLAERMPQAESALLLGYELLQQAFGDDHPRTQKAIGYLLAYFEQIGETSERVETFRRKRDSRAAR
jgi:eukaryotic-like serine/threonine-protein kinase